MSDRAAFHQSSNDHSRTAQPAFLLRVSDLWAVSTPIVKSVSMEKLRDHDLALHFFATPVNQTTVLGGSAGSWV